jgi:type IV pilus assembly protein PilA
MTNRLKQLGQGITEYIIIVALIAIAVIAVYGFFGDAIRSQVGAMTQELTGQDANESSVTGAASSATGEQDRRGLSNYSGN